MAAPVAQRSMRQSFQSSGFAGDLTGIAAWAGGTVLTGIAAVIGCDARAVVRNVIAAARDAGSCRAGRETVRIGSASTAAAAAIQTRCRAAADRRRIRNTSRLATASTAVLLSATPAKNEDHIISFQWDILFTLLLCFLDHFRHAIQLFAREARGGDVQECGYDLLRRILEESIDEVLDRGAFGFIAGYGGDVDVLQPFGLVADVALFLE